MSESGDRLGGEGNEDKDENPKTSPDNSVVRSVKETMESMPDVGAGIATPTEDGRGEQQGSKAAGRRFLTRATAADRLKAQAALTTSIRAMEIDGNPENYGVHHVMTEQLLDILEREHNEYVVNEKLDINLEPPGEDDLLSSVSCDISSQISASALFIYFTILFVSL
jgi:hypothetical protein